VPGSNSNCFTVKSSSPIALESVGEQASSVVHLPHNQLIARLGTLSFEDAAGSIQREDDGVFLTTTKWVLPAHFAENVTGKASRAHLLKFPAMAESA
jgi:hypothetical protein